MPRSATPAPAHLDADSRRLWEKTKKQLRDQDTWQDSDAPLLERYVGALERARHARARIDARELLGEAEEAAGQERKHYGWTSWGSQRQLVQHPDVKTMREAELDAQRYAEALLLTPAARAAKGIDGEPKGAGKFGL